MPATAENTDKLSVYIPRKYREEKLLRRLERLAQRRDRSINYLVVQAIEAFLKREERKSQRQRHRR
jgi:hypothetical protein